MKKTVMLIIMAAAAITLSGCTNNIKVKSPYEITSDKVIMTAKENTITKTSVTIIMTNKTEEQYMYGELYHLEVKKKDTWYIYEPKETLNFNLPAYYIKENESVEKEYNWYHGYGKLKPGTYRLVTDFSREQNEIYVAAEFTIK